MLSEVAKQQFAKLECEYAPVAMKFSFAEPQGIKKCEDVGALCTFVKRCQDTGETFYIDESNDDCVGKMVLGMVDIPVFEGSGSAGYDFEVFKSPAPNAALYHKISKLTRGAHNYVIYSPVADCQFDPDLIIVIADTRQADIIMRANSYISGDLWESKDSHVLGCSWQYAYPYLSGKINHSTVGMHHGQKVRKPYPDGMQIISIPFQKIDEVAKALSEMHWTTIAFREDEESKAELERRIAHWAELSPDLMLNKA